jgi:predicted ferric reductase
MWAGFLRLLLYVAAVLSPLAIAVFSHPQTDDSRIYEIGKSFALVGIMILAMQVILAGRFKWIDKPFGFDIVIRYHRYMAIFASLLILTHPLLLVIGGAGIDLVTSFEIPWYIWVGKAGLLLLLINVFLSVYQQKLKIKFEKWRILHDAAAVILILLVFTHSRFVDSDVKVVPLLKILWAVIPMAFILLLAYHRFVRPWFLSRHPYQVIDVKQEVKGVYTVKLAPSKGRRIYDFFPGQFHFITFHRKGLPSEEHHWTISSSPAEKKFISSTIKELGDFTKTISLTQVGDTATLHGPFGRFSYFFFPKEKELVFIAGGIGITPLMSMLRHMHDMESNISVLLIYASETEIIFFDELKKIENGKHPKLKVIHLLSQPNEEWKGERGHLNLEKFQRFLGNDPKEQSFYISGPTKLVESSVNILKEMKIPTSKIHTEVFSFLE